MLYVRGHTVNLHDRGHLDKRSNWRSKPSKYSCVIIDEAHERTTQTDTILTLLKGILTRRTDLKVSLSEEFRLPYMEAGHNLS